MQQTEAAQQFKSEVGVLMNSYRYISILIKQNIKSHPHLANNLLRLKGDMFEFLMFPNNVLKQQLLSQQRIFQTYKMHTLEMHFNILLKYKPLVQKRIDAAVNCEIPGHASQLSKAYEDFYNRQVLDLERNHLWLFVWAAVLIAYLIFILYTLVRSTRDVETLNDEPLLQAVVTDMSAIHQLRTDKEQLIEALEHTAEPVIVTDIEAKFIYVNLAFENMTGYASDEAVGQFASILRSKTTDPQLYTNMLQTVNSGKIWKGESFIRCKDGSEILVERTISPILNERREIISHVAILHDMTEQKEHAKKLEHTQRLESLGVLAGGIAHDFNNILTAIMGNAALAERSLDIASPAKEKLAKIEQAAQRAADLCQQMLAYSGKGSFVIKTVSLSSLVDEMLHLIDVSIEKNVVIKYHLSESLPCIDVDVAQIQQVILNLIINGNEAIGDKSGVISCSTGVMHADISYLEGSVCDDALQEGRYVYLEVSDTGCGMDAATIEKIFNPFFTTKFTGRGLGMSAVLGIIRGHQGALRVYSEVGKGTTFKILLPVVESAAPEAVSVTTGNGSWQASGTILIVDDEDTIREVAAIMLEDMGFSTLSAEDGKEAVDIYRLHQDEISGVLLDMTMPRMDGKACFRELRRINKDVKVILSSGYSEEDATSRFQGKGLLGFVQKPYSPEYLQEVMKSLSTDLAD